MDEKLRELKRDLRAAEKERERLTEEIDQRQTALSEEYMARLRQYPDANEADKRVSDEMMEASRCLDKLEMQYLANEETIEDLCLRIEQYTRKS